MDTASTFKLGVFPFTNDPTGSNGNGANGPCWSRDADNHQGYSTGPLADTVVDAPNAPGVEVASSATWVGDQRDHDATTRTRAAATTSRSRSRWRSCPPPSIPDADGAEHHAVRQRRQRGRRARPRCATSTRARRALAWSAFGSVQSDPYRWGHATLAGLHAAGGPADDAGAAERRRTRTSTGSTRRRRSPSRPATACRSRAACRRRADDRIAISAGEARARRGGARRSRPTGPGQRARVPVVGRQGLHPGLDRRAARRRPTRRPTTA